MRKKILPDSPSRRMVSEPLLALIFTSWKMLGRLNSCRFPWRSTALLSLVAVADGAAPVARPSVTSIGNAAADLR